MLYLGIDWSEHVQYVCICNEHGARLSQFSFELSLAGFQRLEQARAHLAVPTEACLVAIETTQHLLVDYLLDQRYAVYWVPPNATHAYRNRQRASQAHTDQSDAALLAEIVRTDRASHVRLRPNQPLTQQLHALVRLSETLRRSIQRQSNQLRAWLVRAFPAALELFAELTTQTGLHFLSAYPSASAAHALSLDEFQSFCCAHGYTRPQRLAQHYAHLQAAWPTASPALVQAAQEPVRLLATLLLPQVQARAQVHRQLQALFAQHPDAPIFDSLPEAGALLAPALLVKFGDQRERFPSAQSVQALAGTCPVTERSGQKRWIHFRLACDHEFRRIAQQYARVSLRSSGWAQAYWAELRPHCRSDSHAYRCLANRWLAIIWKLWQTRQPYDEAHHLQQRAARRKPLALPVV